MPNRIPPGQRPPLVARKVIPAVRVDMADLASRKNECRLFRRDQHLKHPRRLHYSWEIESAFLCLEEVGTVLQGSLVFSLPFRVVRRVSGKDAIFERRSCIAFHVVAQPQASHDAVIGDPDPRPIRQPGECAMPRLWSLRRQGRRRNEQDGEARQAIWAHGVCSCFAFPRISPSAPTADMKLPERWPSRAGCTVTLIWSPTFKVPGFQPPWST